MYSIALYSIAHLHELVRRDIKPRQPQSPRWCATLAREVEMGAAQLEVARAQPAGVLTSGQRAALG